MNKKDREEIQAQMDILEGVKSNLETILEREQEKLDALPENLQSSERAEKFQNGIDAITDSTDYIQEILDRLIEVME